METGRRTLGDIDESRTAPQGIIPEGPRVFMRGSVVTDIGPLHLHARDKHAGANVPPTGGGVKGKRVESLEPRAASRE
jgi:hypothetical protein